MTISQKVPQSVLIDIAKLLEPTAFENLSDLDWLIMLSSPKNLLDSLSEPQKQMLKNLVDAQEEALITSDFDDSDSEIYAADMESVIVTAAANPKLQQAYLTVLKEINPKYYVTRDNPVKFATVQKQITSLIAVVEHCIEEFSGMLTDNQDLAKQIMQLHYEVSNYFLLASTLDPNNYELCEEWLLKARYFIQENGLQNTDVDAVVRSLQGEHLSMGFEMKLLPKFSYLSVMRFCEAIRIHLEKLGSKIKNAADVDLRHAIICLADITVQFAIDRAISAKEVTDQVIRACEKASDYLSKLPEKVLVKIVEETGKPPITVNDNYRIADCYKIRAKIAFLQGDLSGALLLAKKAETHMAAAVPAVPQQLALIKKLLTDLDDALARSQEIEVNQNIACIHKLSDLMPIVRRDRIKRQSFSPEIIVANSLLLLKLKRARPIKQTESPVRKRVLLTNQMF